MNNLDRPMEFLLAGVFLYLGFRTIFSYKRRPKALGAKDLSLPLGMPHGTMIAVGLFEIVAAFALVTPFGPLPQATLVLLAAAGLALLTLAAVILRVRRHESASPIVALFLLAMFVIVGRTL